MGLTWFFSIAITTAAQPAGAPAPAQTPAPAQAAAPETATPDPSWAPEPVEPTSAGLGSPSTIEFQRATVHSPRYGLGISGVSVDRGPEKYQLHAKSWKDIVRDDPDLLHWHRQSRMLGGGIALTAVGGTWLALSTALALDGIYTGSAVGGLFQWVMPTTLLASGSIMTIVAVSARRKLRNAQRRMFAAPYASAGQAGVAVTGRF